MVLIKVKVRLLLSAAPILKILAWNEDFEAFRINVSLTKIKLKVDINHASFIVTHI